MAFLEWVKWAYENERFLCVLMALAAVGMLLAAVYAGALRRTGVYVAFTAMLFGGVGIEVFCGSVGLRAGFVGLSALLLFGGAVYLLLFMILAIAKGIEKRKLRRAEIARKLFYTLPDRDNSYVRARLNTTLYVKEERLNADMDTSKGTNKPIRLGHARQLLEKVRSAPLTPAERLQAEEMHRAFSMYLLKEGWTAEDLRAVNDLCAALLKLSAKYAI